jgi:hypothetical protein
VSAAAFILPFVWAARAGQAVPLNPVEPEVYFYRKYTEGLLRRYVRLSMESGRVPSLLGQEMFRGKVTCYRVQGFDDVVIFVHDVEKCLDKLNDGQRHLISRIALQRYSHSEAAVLMGLTNRTVVRRYREAVDRLTKIFLYVKMLQPLNLVKGEKS